MNSSGTPWQTTCESDNDPSAVIISTSYKSGHIFLISPRQHIKMKSDLYKAKFASLKLTMLLAEISKRLGTFLIIAAGL